MSETLQQRCEWLAVQVLSLKKALQVEVAERESLARWYTAEREGFEAAKRLVVANLKSKRKTEADFDALARRLERVRVWADNQMRSSDSDCRYASKLGDHTAETKFFAINKRMVELVQLIDGQPCPLGEK